MKKFVCVCFFCERKHTKTYFTGQWSINGNVPFKEWNVPVDEYHWPFEINQSVSNKSNKSNKS
jgi:hypothetical protein